jgi:hypothetical protein
VTGRPRRKTAADLARNMGSRPGRATGPTEGVDQATGADQDDRPDVTEAPAAPKPAPTAPTEAPAAPRPAPTAPTEAPHEAPTEAPGDLAPPAVRFNVRMTELESDALDRLWARVGVRRATRSEVVRALIVLAEGDTDIARVIASVVAQLPRVRGVQSKNRREQRRQ